MFVLVTYDVNTETPEGRRRLRQVARICKNYGVRVQNSVFECVVDSVQLMELKFKIGEVINSETSKAGQGKDMLSMGRIADLFFASR